MKTQMSKRKEKKTTMKHETGKMKRKRKKEDENDKTKTKKRCHFKRS